MISISKSETADTRTCDFTKVDREEYKRRLIRRYLNRAETPAASGQGA